MADRLADASQQAAADAVTARINAGGAGSLKIYTGSQPADADTTPSGTLLVTITLANPAYGAANTSGTAALQGTPRSGTGAAAGLAGCFEVVSGGGAKVFAGAVRATADTDNGEELVLDNKNIAVGQTVNVASLNYTQPAG